VVVLRTPGLTGSFMPPSAESVDLLTARRSGLRAAARGCAADDVRAHETDVGQFERAGATAAKLRRPPAGPLPRSALCACYARGTARARWPARRKCPLATVVGAHHEAGYLTVTAITSAHSMSDTMPYKSATVALAPPAAIRHSFNVYKGLVPISPNTTPKAPNTRAARLAERSVCSRRCWRI